MSKYIIFILIFNVLCFAQNFDTYSISDHKTVGKNIVKRILQELPNVKTNPESSTANNLKNYLNEQAVSEIKTHDAREDTSKTESDKEKKFDINQNVNIAEEKTLVPSNDKNAISSINENEVSKTNSSSTVNESSFITPDGNFKKTHGNSEHPGATLRGFYVFLGLSIIIIIYFLIKAFRLRPGASAPATVRKYGIVGRRSDMEMLPLPLAEEEDDDTLFDMGSQVNR